MYEEADYHIYKVAVLGNMASGKTTLINRFINQCSDHYYPSTTSEFRQFSKLDCINKNTKNPRPYFFSIQDTMRVSLNNPVLKTDDHLRQRLRSIIENQEQMKYVDPKNFPWDQPQRPYYAYIFTVSMADPDTFDSVREVIEKISQIEKDRRKNRFISKKIIVGTMSDTPQASLPVNADKWNSIKQELDGSGVQLTEFSCFEPTDNVNDIFSGLAEYLNSNTTIQGFENQMMSSLNQAKDKKNHLENNHQKNSQSEKLILEVPSDDDEDSDLVELAE